MNKMKRIISITLATVTVACALIFMCCCDPYIEIHVDGVYAVVHTTRHTAIVYRFDKDDSVGAYESQVCYVPESITYNGKVYTVTELSGWLYERELVVGGHAKRIVIPQTVTEIDLFSFKISDTFDYLEEIEVHRDNENYSSLNGVLYSKDYSTLIMYPPAKSDTTMTILREVTAIYENQWNYCNKNVEKVTVEAGNLVFSEVDGVLLSNGGTRLEYVPYAHDSVLELPDGVHSIARLSLRYANIEHLYIPSSVYNVEYVDSIWYNPLRYVSNLYFEESEPQYIVGWLEYLNEVHCGVSRDEFREMANL